MQTLLRDPAAGIMHSMIYFGFLVLLVLGMLQKLMPHIGRLHLFRQAGSAPPPDANALLHQGASRASLWLGELGLVVFAAGVLAGDGAVARIGAIAWLAAVMVIVGQFARIVMILRGKLDLKQRELGTAPS